jgi:hypothetical protein
MYQYEYSTSPTAVLLQLVLFVLIFSAGIAFMFGGPQKAGKTLMWIIMNIIIWPPLRFVRWAANSLLQGTGHGRRRNRRGG